MATGRSYLIGDEYPEMEDLDLREILQELNQGCWNLRKNAPRARPKVGPYLFHNTLNMAATLWRTVLSAADRQQWIEASATYAFARPGRSASPANGWTLFAGTCFAPLYFGAPITGETTIDQPSDPSNITFDIAEIETQTMHFTLTMPPPHGDWAPGLTLIYQIQYSKQEAADRLRRTILCGWHQNVDPEVASQGWWTPALQEIRADEDVRCLVRHHRGLHGVTNFDLTQSPS